MAQMKKGTLPPYVSVDNMGTVKTVRGTRTRQDKVGQGNNSPADAPMSEVWRHEGLWRQPDSKLATHQYRAVSSSNSQTKPNTTTATPSTGS